MINRTYAKRSPFVTPFMFVTETCFSDYIFCAARLWKLVRICLSHFFVWVLFVWDRIYIYMHSKEPTDCLISCAQKWWLPFMCLDWRVWLSKLKMSPSNFPFKAFKKDGEINGLTFQSGKKIDWKQLPFLCDMEVILKKFNSLFANTKSGPLYHVSLIIQTAGYSE